MDDSSEDETGEQSGHWTLYLHEYKLEVINHKLLSFIDYVDLRNLIKADIGYILTNFHSTLCNFICVLSDVILKIMMMMMMIGH